MRLLLKLAGPVPSWKKRAVPVRRLLNEYCVFAKDTWRHIILRRIHPPSKIWRASHLNTETMLQYYSMYQSRLREYFCPPFWQWFAKFLGCENFATYGKLRLRLDWPRGVPESLSYWCMWIIARVVIRECSSTHYVGSAQNMVTPI